MEAELSFFLRVWDCFWPVAHVPNSSKREMTRITGETIRNVCGNWKRCTVKCETPDPYTGDCPAVTTTKGSKYE